MTQTVETQPWTEELANRALPLVRRIADDIVTHYAEWRSLVEQFEVAVGDANIETPNSEADRLAFEVQRVAAEIDGFVKELEEIGVECKSMEIGLFDFRSERDGRPVYLCWMRGEDRVDHWHDIDSGFEGRQPL